jgi:hypothetical protein
MSEPEIRYFEKVVFEAKKELEEIERNFGLKFMKTKLRRKKKHIFPWRLLNSLTLIKNRGGLKMQDVKKMNIKEKALEELRQERTVEAKNKLKQLYRKQADAKRVLANIDREIEDYLAELDDIENDLG